MALLRRRTRRDPAADELAAERDRLADEVAAAREALVQRNRRIEELESLVDEQRIRIAIVRGALDDARDDRTRLQERFVALRRSATDDEEELRRLRRLAAAVPGEEGRRLRESMLPPAYTVDAQYAARRRAFLEVCVARAGLAPGDAVLDVGCGVGGLAELFRDQLDDDGRYEGFDVDAWSVAVATDRIGVVDDRFRFRHADVRNPKYNPGGSVADAGFRFPFDDDRFDLVVLRSVFTHMLPDGVEHYLAEISRVLKPGGRAVISYFLYDEARLEELRERRGGRAFANDLGTHRTDRTTAESAVAYDEAFIRRLHADRGLPVLDPIVYGSWCGPGGAGTHQDVVIAGSGTAAEG